MTVIALNAETAYCSKKNIVVPGPSSVAAGIATRGAARIVDVEPSTFAVTLPTPVTDGDTVKYSQTLTSLG
jgi:hypothetical protein